MVLAYILIAKAQYKQPFVESVKLHLYGMVLSLLLLRITINNMPCFSPHLLTILNFTPIDL